MKRIDYLTIIAAAAILTSCGSRNDFVGSWTAASPNPMEAEIPAAASATSLLSIDFGAPEGGKDSGPVYFSSIIQAAQPVTADAAADFNTTSPYQVNVSASAAINGTWSRSSDDDDDLLIAFDMSSLIVDVDPSGVVFSENMLTGQQQPRLDSLTNTTAARWKDQIETAVKANLARYTRLDDVEVSSDGSTLSFEVKNVRGSDQDIVMRKVLSE